MVKDAEVHAAEDKKRKELVEAKNHAESLIHSTQKSMSELGDKISAADKSTVEAAIASLKSVTEGSDAEAIKSKTNDLAQAAMKLGEAMYKAQQAASAGSGGNGAGNPGDMGAGQQQAPEDDVVDADFTEVKDDDKKSA
jgi:molecular chaperone DnaK